MKVNYAICKHKVKPTEKSINKSTMEGNETEHPAFTESSHIQI